MSKNCSKGALENYPLTQTFFLCQKLHLSSHAQSRINLHLAEACTFLKGCVQVCRESRIHTEGKTHSCCRSHIDSVYLCCFVHSCFSSKWGYSVTVLMSAAALVPPAHRCFEYFSLEKFGCEPFHLEIL